MKRLAIVGLLAAVATSAAAPSEAAEKAPEGCAWKRVEGARPQLFCPAPNGTSVPFAVPEGFDPETLAKAEGGDVRAMTLVGAFRLYDGDGEAAAAWFEKAVKTGDLRAMSYLGLMRLDGVGGSKDPAEGLRLIRVAADAKLPSAMFNLGVIYSTGRGVPEDRAEGARWLRAAAEEGHGRAMPMLGVLALRAPADQAEALRWLHAAAARGEVEAMLILGRLHAAGVGLPKDGPEALRWFRTAAERGDARGMFYLGTMYDQGIGAEADPAEAARWYRRAADLNLADGMRALAFDYARGRGGVPKDQDEAHRLNLRAAEHGLDVGVFGRDPFSDELADALGDAEAPLWPPMFSEPLGSPG